MDQQISKTLRPAAVAGTFYPDDQSELSKMIDAMLSTGTRRGFTAENSPLTQEMSSAVKALIVPHAGYRYSGEVAAAAYRSLMSVRQEISRVVLLGPAHRVRVQGIAMSGTDYFATPLGKIPLDVETIRQCVDQFPFVSINNKSHQAEHSLETQLPFIQRCLGEFSLIPFVIGEAQPEQVERCLDFLWGNEETLILVSSDLSHFLPYDQAREIDQITCQAICNLNPDPITYKHACGQVGVRGLLEIARKKKLHVKQIDVRNSGDTAGRKDQVVGYGSFGFYPSAHQINHRQRNEFTRIAWAAIDHGLDVGKMPSPSLKNYGPPFSEPGASFITLSTLDGKLRGCIGNLESVEPLLHSVSHNAYKAAFSDPRFPALRISERKQVQLQISILSKSEQIESDSEQGMIDQLRPFIDGLILTTKEKRGTFLPTVWDTFPDPVIFLQQLKRKAGIAENYWGDSIKVYRYTTETWK